LDEAMEAVRQAVKDMWVDEGKRAEIALTQADALAHAAVSDIGDTSRELRDKTEEIAAPPGGKTSAKDKPDPNGPGFPRRRPSSWRDPMTRDSSTKPSARTRQCPFRALTIAGPCRPLERGPSDRAAQSKLFLCFIQSGTALAKKLGSFGGELVCPPIPRSLNEPSRDELF
jgi:hypothetical protein